MMMFRISGDSNRAELRQMREWKPKDAIASNSTVGMRGEVDLKFPSTPSLLQYTFAQIHTTGNLGNPTKPFLRLVWMREKEGRSDGIWAVVRQSVFQNVTEWYYLTSRRDGLMSFDITMKQSGLFVSIDNKMLFSDNDVSYWNDVESYFKAGAYLQDEGEARVGFNSLEYYYP